MKASAPIVHDDGRLSRCSLPCEAKRRKTTNSLRDRGLRQRATMVDFSRPFPLARAMRSGEVLGKRRCRRIIRTRRESEATCGLPAHFRTAARPSPTRREHPLGMPLSRRLCRFRRVSARACEAGIDDDAFPRNDAQGAAFRREWPPENSRLMSATRPSLFAGVF